MQLGARPAQGRALAALAKALAGAAKQRAADARARPRALGSRPRPGAGHGGQLARGLCPLGCARWPLLSSRVLARDVAASQRRTDAVSREGFSFI